MACMHSYYISNTKDEVKSAYQELNETEFEQVIIQSRLPFDTLTDEEANSDDSDENEDDTNTRTTRSISNKSKLFSI